MRSSHLLLVLLLGAPLHAQSDKLPRAISAIRESDLRRDLAALASDGMRGREAGTVDELRASMWIAEAMRRIGLVPKGEDGGWFQWWSIRRSRIASGQSTVRIGGRQLVLWKEIAPAFTVMAELSAPTVWVPDARDTLADLRGKVAITPLARPPAASIRSTTNTPDFNYTRAAITAASRALLPRGVSAIVLVADSIVELAFEGVGSVVARGTYDVIGGAPRFVRPTAAGAAAPLAPAQVPVLLARRSVLTDSASNGQLAEIRIRPDSFEYPSVNIIGMVRGTDPVLRDEYILFSSHQDHDGVRYAVNGDSVWSGADDNGSTSVALLAIARAWTKQPSKRSALFVFHGAEERGLLGSRYHVAHPVVPLDRIVAVLNGDMIGRNHPDTAALMGSQPPHRNSAALVRMAIDANRAVSRFVIDSTWDRPDHPESWYFRSDHVPYAAHKVPSLFFSSNLHPDYHTPRDKPAAIDYAKLTRMTQWMYMTGWLAANATQRPSVDPGFELR